ncbi:putative amidase PB8B6.03 [Mycena sanguinolenta]|uniref:amidase n=1 Tax=Mycena sanguinolenta TaxID=230812 RepID=A0A8H6YE35_9AGAR|nr:putative amidase PB8B6.03 [Mycena sanguinolenta]
MWPFSSGYQVIAEGKQKERDSAISAAPKFDLNEHGAFLRATASEIVDRIERGEWTASQVVRAYIAQAAVAQKTTNCLTEVLFSQALERARELDVEFASTKKLRGPLHGVPISVKDQCEYYTRKFDCIKRKAPVSQSISRASTLRWGSVPLLTSRQPVMPTLSPFSRLRERFQSSRPKVPRLLRVTAPTYTKNCPANHVQVPQLLRVTAPTYTKNSTMFSYECANPVWGRSVNPYNGGFTCGGSSGGEAAVLAMNGSALGIGSDIGGSLRIPAAFCGIYALKPTPLRVSSVGAGVAVPGFEGIIAVVGPMARSVEDLELFCRVIFGVQRRSNIVAPIPYTESKLPEKLRFGYYTGEYLLRDGKTLITDLNSADCYVKGSPASKRAISETVAALQKEGHECIEITIPNQLEAFNVFVGLTSADGYKTLLSGIKNDPLDSSLLVVAHGSALPGFLRSFASWFISFFLKDEKFAGAVASTGAKPMREYLRWVARRNKYNDEFYEKVWNKHQLDGIIAPVLAMPQIHTGGFTTLFSLAAGTALYNLVNSPSGSIPVTKVDAAKDQITEEWLKAPSPSLVERALYHGKKPIYDPVAMQGMPVGIQVVAKRWEDEKVLGMMKIIDKALGKDRGFGPGSFLDV